MTTAPRTLLALLLGLTLASLLNADSLVDAAERLELGPSRVRALAVARPVLMLSQDLGFDLAGEWGDRWVKPWFAGGDGEDIGADRRSVERAPMAAVSPAPVLSVPETAPLPVEPEPLPCVPWEPAAVRPDAKLVVLYVGDSLLQYVEPTLRAEQAQPELFSHRFDWRYSTGLARPDYFDWPNHLSERLKPEHPAAIVVMLGANDGQAISVENRILRVETESWVEEYRARALALAKVAGSAEAEVFWIGLPVMRSRGMYRRAEIMNSAFKAAADTVESVQFVDIWDLFADDDGNYTRYLTDPDGVRRSARGSDGIHLSRAGTRRLVRRLDRVFAQTWDLEAWKEPLPERACPSIKPLADSANAPSAVIKSAP